MLINWRPLRLEDFDAFWEVAHREPFQGVSVALLRRGWAKLFNEQRMRGAFIEGVSEERPPRPVGGGATVFISDRFAEELARRRAPYTLPRVLLTAESAGSPILDNRAIARANATGGLNLAIVHLGWKRGLPVEDFLLVQGAMVSSFQRVHEGFHLKAIWGENYGLLELEFCTASGSWVIQSDFRDHYLSNEASRPDPSQHPFLLRATPEEVRPATPTSAMFVFTPPELALTPLQKDVLDPACDGFSNREIGEILNLKEDNVRRVFRRIYNHIKRKPAICKRVFGSTPSGNLPTHSARREALVTYISSHKQEIRPWPRRIPKVRNGPPALYPLIVDPQPSPAASQKTMAEWLATYAHSGDDQATSSLQ